MGILSRPHACHECLLYDFVPEQYRTDDVPCHHIPLNKQGDTVAQPQQSEEELRENVKHWLKRTIARIEAERAKNNGDSATQNLERKRSAHSSKMKQVLVIKGFQPQITVARGRLECRTNQSFRESNMQRPFASLNPQEALHVAIFIEERNAGIYHRFAEMFTEFRDADSLEIASVFWDMAVEEKRHSSALQEKYQERFGNGSCTLTEEDLQEMIEVPKLEDADVFAARPMPQNIARERALQVALAAETSAHDFYNKLVEQTEDASLRRLYSELSDDGRRTRRLLAESACRIIRQQRQGRALRGAKSDR